MNRVLVALALAALVPLGSAASPATTKAASRASVVVPLTPSVLASGRRHKRVRVRRRHRPWLTLSADYNTDADLSRPFNVGSPRQVLPSFYLEHAGLVQHALMRFRAEPVNVNPPLFDGHEAPKMPAFFFAPAIDTDDVIEVGRQRDQMLEFRDAPVGSSAVGAGIGAFAASLMAAAHGPRRLRLLFDGPVHLGPAIFDSGGMGMGLSGSLPAPAGVPSDASVASETSETPEAPEASNAHEAVKKQTPKGDVRAPAPH